MKTLQRLILAIMLFGFLTSWTGGYFIGRASRPELCEGCSHPFHGSKTCLIQVPCILGQVACTCEGFELKRKQLTLTPLSPKQEK